LTSVRGQSKKGQTLYYTLWGKTQKKHVLNSEHSVNPWRGGGGGGGGGVLLVEGKEPPNGGYAF